MHAAIRIGDTVLLASDGNSLGKPQFQGVSLSFTVDSAAQAEKVFGALADGGKVTMPLATTFFAKRFGQVTDRFGLSWMILLPA
jgi:PhnB protein